MNENFNVQNIERKYETQQDVQREIDELMKKRESIINEAPKLYLEIKNAPYLLHILFENDGTPKANFRVSEAYKKKVYYSLKHPRKNSKGEIYYGNLTDGSMFNEGPNIYKIIVTPDFFSDEELEILQKKHFITKKIGNTDVEFRQGFIGYSYIGNVELYREKVKHPRKKIKEIDEIISALNQLKSKLPKGSYEVVINSENEINNVDNTDYPHR